MKLKKCPQSLFDICITLVGHNIDLVESFCGFPSLIGEKIFMVAMETERFKEDIVYLTTALHLFNEAFGDELLSALSVSGKHLGLNYSLEQLLVFQHITGLDVSRCGLGDDHEIITHVSQLYSLEVLYLCDNAISDTGVQKMTAPYRMFQRGPAKLQIVNLSGNVNISLGCLKYFTTFHILQQVIVSGSLHPTNSNQRYAESDWNITPQSTCHLPPVHTAGWATVVVDRWMKQAAFRSKQRKPRKSSFYAKNKCVEDLLHINIDPASFSTAALLVATRNTASCAAIKSLPTKCGTHDKSKITDGKGTVTIEDESSNHSRDTSKFQTNFDQSKLTGDNTVHGTIGRRKFGQNRGMTKAVSEKTADHLMIKNAIDKAMSDPDKQGCNKTVQYSNIKMTNRNISVEHDDNEEDIMNMYMKRGDGKRIGSVLGTGLLNNLDKCVHDNDNDTSLEFFQQNSLHMKSCVKSENEKLKQTQGSNSKCFIAKPVIATKMSKMLRLNKEKHEITSEHKRAKLSSQENGSQPKITKYASDLALKTVKPKPKFKLLNSSTSKGDNFADCSPPQIQSLYPRKKIRMIRNGERKMDRRMGLQNEMESTPNGKRKMENGSGNEYELENASKHRKLAGTSSFTEGQDIISKSENQSSLFDALNDFI